MSHVQKCHSPHLIKRQRKKVKARICQERKRCKEAKGKKIQKTVDYLQNWFLKGIYETLKSTQGFGFQRSLITSKLG